MDRALIKKARQTNLGQYLISAGVPLKHNGNRYRHKQHDSLVFTENAYYWNSRQEHGNAIDYLVRHMGMDFVGAVLALTSQNRQVQKPHITRTNDFDINKMRLNPDCDKAKKYLSQARQIGTMTLNQLVNKKLLLQEMRTNNIVFPIYDENNNCVGAELHGITGKRFKGVSSGSKYGYGFNVRYSRDNTFDYALFFESAIDLLSFMEYKMNFENKSLNRCVLISMGGLKINIVKHSLKIYDGAKAVLCVDNDNAGQAFKKNVESSGILYINRAPNEQYKDWSEQLIDVRKRDKPIQRLLNRGLEGSQEVSTRDI